MKRTKLLCLIILSLLSLRIAVQAQNEKELLAALMEEEQEAINALVMYPEETRKQILEVTRYPDQRVGI
ncbi:MAG: hypothetical protein AAFO94_21620, partial [Bacteroidota bacterium]